MLGKLLKKDLKSTYRLFIPLLCGYGVASVLGKILFEIVLSQEQFADNSGFFNGITIFTFLYMGLFIIYLVACYLMTSVFVIYDFYKTMVSDHGYLTHTLPVKTSSLIWSKTLISAFWHIVMNLIVGLSVLLLFTGHLRQIPVMHILENFLDSMDLMFKNYTFYTGLNAFINLFNGPLLFFACIAVGQLWKNHRVLGAILTYIGVHVFTQILSTVVLVISGTGNIYFNSSDFFYTGYMIYATMFSILSTVVCFLITNYILSRKLNLE